MTLSKIFCTYSGTKMQYFSIQNMLSIRVHSAICTRLHAFSRFFLKMEISHNQKLCFVQNIARDEQISFSILHIKKNDSNFFEQCKRDIFPRKRGNFIFCQPRTYRYSYRLFFSILQVEQKIRINFRSGGSSHFLIKILLDFIIIYLFFNAFEPSDISIGYFSYIRQIEQNIHVNPCDGEASRFKIRIFSIVII